MALVTLVVGLCQLFSDVGISAAIIQRKEISRSQLDSLFWINIILASLMSAAVVALAPFIAWLLAEPRVKVPILLGGVTLFIIGLGRQHQALLQKELAFRTIAVIEVSGAFVGLVAGVVTAVFGWGVYALLTSLITKSCWCSIGYLLVGIRTHTPSLMLRLREVRGFVVFGMYQTGQGLANYIASQVDILIVGRLLGVEALGIWTVAKEITLKPATLINPVLTRVAFPVFSKMKSTDAIRSGYLRITRLLASVNAPIYLVILAMAPELVLLLLGPAWLATVPTLRLLACWGLVRSFVNPCGALLLATGHVRLLFKWNLVIVPLMGLGLTAAASQDLLATGAALLALQSAFVVLHVPVLLKTAASISFKDFAFCLLGPLLISTGALIPPSIIAHEMGPIGSLATFVLIYFAFLTFCNWLFNKPVTEDLKLFIRG